MRGGRAGDTVGRRSARRRRRRLPGGCCGPVPAGSVRLSYYPRAQQVMHVQGADRQALVVDHEKAADLAVLHDLQRLGREHALAYGLAAPGHDLLDVRIADIDVLIQGAAQVAVSEDADELAGAVGHAGQAQALAGHFQQGVAQRCLRCHQRHLLATVHDVVYQQQQASTEAAARVREGEVLGTETAGLEQSDGQRITHHQCGGGAGGGGRFSGQASCSTPVSRLATAARARVESGLPVMLISGMPKRLISGSRVTTSAVLPELDRAMTTSWAVIMPMSPWLASPGCTKNAGEPVLARVAAILRPIWPDLPIPVTTIRPGHWISVAQARSKSPSSRFSRLSTASRSMAMVRRAERV